MEHITSEKGKPLILFEAYSYRKQRIHANGSTISYRCTHKECKGRVHLINGIMLIAAVHDCGLPNEDRNNIKKTLHHIKQRATITQESPRQIIFSAQKNLNAEEATIMPSYNALQQMIQRERKRNGHPYPNPKSLYEYDTPEKLQMTENGDQFLLYDSGKDDSSRFLIFATQQNMNTLRRAEIWFIDGTFSVVPKLFYQLYTVHASVEGKILPLLFALLSNKTEASYRRLFLVLKEQELQPKSIMADFEKGVHNAAQFAFPGLTLHGCFFHLGQCIYRKVQESGLKADYNTDRELRCQVKMLLALAMLPLDDVIATFEQLHLDCRLDTLMDYFEDNFIGRKRNERRAIPLFAVHIWNVHHLINNDLPRTNNSVEGWHRAFKRFIGCDHPNIYIFIDKLKSEQKNTENLIMQASIARNIAPKSRKRYLDLNERLKKLILSYNQDEKISFLRSVSNNLTI